MGNKFYKPTTPSRRNMVTPSFEEITKKAPEKSLITILKKNSGRNNMGRITVRHRGGGNKKKYRIVDFRRTEEGARRLSVSNTIPTVPPISPLPKTKTAGSPIF